jgi:hypothetical protein
VAYSSNQTCPIKGVNKLRCFFVRWRNRLLNETVDSSGGKCKAKIEMKGRRRCYNAVVNSSLYQVTEIPKDLVPVDKVMPGERRIVDAHEFNAIQLREQPHVMAPHNTKTDQTGT